jgi:hypothetical protein
MAGVVMTGRKASTPGGPDADELFDALFAEVPRRTPGGGDQPTGSIDPDELGAPEDTEETPATMLDLGRARSRMLELQLLQNGAAEEAAAAAPVVPKPIPPDAEDLADDAAAAPMGAGAVSLPDVPMPPRPADLGFPSLSHTPRRVPQAPALPPGLDDGGFDGNDDAVSPPYNDWSSMGFGGSRDERVESPAGGVASGAGSASGMSPLAIAIARLREGVSVPGELLRGLDSGGARGAEPSITVRAVGPASLPENMAPRRPPSTTPIVAEFDGMAYVSGLLVPPMARRDTSAQSSEDVDDEDSFPSDGPVLGMPEPEAFAFGEASLPPYPKEHIPPIEGPVAGIAVKTSKGVRIATSATREDAVEVANRPPSGNRRPAAPARQTDDASQNFAIAAIAIVVLLALAWMFAAGPG